MNKIEKRRLLEKTAPALLKAAKLALKKMVGVGHNNNGKLDMKCFACVLISTINRAEGREV